MMNKIFGFIATTTLLLAADHASAQTQTVLDGAYVKEHNVTKRVIPYPHLREADVMYARRIWQELDLKEKMNHPLYYPVEPIAERKSLFHTIKAALEEGSIIAYGLGPTNDDDEFRYPQSRAQLDTLLNPTKTVKIEDVDTGEIDYKDVPNPIASSDVTRFRIKEEWIFDKQRSERYVRIIGICPMAESYDDEGVKRGYSPLFWLYFPECRYVFNNSETFNFMNDAQRVTYEDIFQKRMFSSFIVKESNVYDRTVKGYARGLDLLLESERIKQELFEVEHDLWHY